MAVLVPDGTGAMQEPETILIPVNGVWQEPAVIRTQENGIWRDVWPTKKYLYREGEEYTTVTGGWAFPTVSSDTTISRYDSFVKTGSITRTKESDGIRLFAKTGSDLKTVSRATAYTSKMISLEGYHKLFMEFDQSVVYAGEYTQIHSPASIDGTAESPNGADHLIKKLFVKGTSIKTEKAMLLEVDISQVTSTYVFVTLCAYAGEPGYDTKEIDVTIRKIWME